MAESMMLHVQAFFMVLFYHLAARVNSQCYLFSAIQLLVFMLGASSIFFNPLLSTWCFEHRVQFEILRKKN